MKKGKINMGEYIEEVFRRWERKGDEREKSVNKMNVNKTKASEKKNKKRPQHIKEYIFLKSVSTLYLQRTNSSMRTH